MRGRGATSGWRDPQRAALWPLGLVGAILGILLMSALAYRALRTASAAWDRLLENQVADLVEAQRLSAVSELGARLVRDAVLAPDPRTLRALGANQAEVEDLLGRARSRARDPSELALVESLAADHAKLRAIAAALLEARLSGAPPRFLLARLEREMAPLRVRIDDALARHVRAHEEGLAAGRSRIGAEERRALAVVLGAAALGVILASVLGLSLGRSLLELRRSEARFRATFEQAAVGIAHVSPDGRWLRTNRRYRELLGRSEQELAELSVTEVMHPEDRAADSAARDRLLRGEIEGYALEARILRRDGRSQWVNVTCALVRDRTGRPRYLVRAAEDLSARKRVERDLREAVQARDEFLQVASHELRTPLATLRLRVEGVRAAVARGVVEPRRIEEKAEAAVKQTLRLNALLDELLDVSRLAAEGRVPLEPEDADLVQVARDVVERVAPAAAREGTRIRLAADSPVAVRVDRARIEQALGHLLSNALRYGVGHPVDVRVEADGDLARLAVVDRGVGIDPADAERIFERFERAASWRNYGGLGLGLYLTRRIVEAHGGTVHAEGSRGAGATFVIELPKDGPPPAEVDDGGTLRERAAPDQPSA
jgi:PAS domain S-box-containing protein